ncbi:flavin reductase family protein, partial [Deltaproteobacteria bacterium OttesenSCG-928-K17]|nr:flavin reductase family protein [Deltaproteobacteria bacterium OttesenSCG-928-K17]
EFMKKSLGPKTLTFPLPVYLVGSYDEEGKANIMNAAWGGIACSDPPCISVSIQPIRHSFAAIMKNRAFTISVPNSALAPAADLAGLVSGRNHDKFALGNLTAVKSEVVNAPYVAECPVVLECELVKTVELGSHTMFVGRILDVKVDDDIKIEDGALDMAGVDPMVYNPGGEYHRIGGPVGKAFSIGKSLKK